MLLAERRALAQHRRALQNLQGQGRRVATRAELHDLGLQGLRERGLIPPVQGGAVGKGAAAFFNNFPQGGYNVDASYWEQQTERNDAPAPKVTYPGFGGGLMESRIANVGLLASIKLWFVGQLVVSTAAVTTSYRWPWGIFSNISLAVNGQTGLISASGTDLRAHRNRLFRNPQESVSSAPGTDARTNPVAGTSIATGTYNVVLVFEIPIVHDMSSLAGLLFAQSDANYFSWTAQPELAANLFSTAANVALTGNLFQELTFFDIPVAPASGNQAGGPVLPPMNWLHGLVANDAPVNGIGDNAVPLLKESGQLLAVYDYIDNGAAFPTQLAPGTSYDEVRLEYGTNRKPEVFSGGNAGQGALLLLNENQQNYNGVLLPGYKVFDFEADNPDRDIVYPRGVSELQMVNKITSGATVNAGAKCHFVTETLYSAV